MQFPTIAESVYYTARISFEGDKALEAVRRMSTKGVIDLIDVSYDVVFGSLVNCNAT